MTARTRSLWLLHGVVVIFGFTGILGKLITLDAEPLVFWRVSLGGVSTALYLAWRREWRRWLLKDLVQAAVVGCIVAAHWVTFFAAIKVSSVGLALTMLATAPLFIGFIEPVVFRRKVAWRELLVASAVFVGIATVFQAERDQVDGMVLGLSSAALAALFSTFNGVLVKRLEPVNLSAVELLSASAAMLVWLTWRGQACLGLYVMSAEDWVWVAVLAVVATSFAFVVSIQVLKNLTPFESAMAINLEPLYAIVLAWWIFGERFSPGFYLGAAMVLGAVFLDSWWRAQTQSTANNDDAT